VLDAPARQQKAAAAAAVMLNINSANAPTNAPH
jgi:hypothetical protein